MKLTKYLTPLLSLLLLASCLAMHAQGVPAPDAVAVPDDLMNKPFQEWQLNLTTLMVASQIIGRGIKGIRGGGGIKGFFTGIWLGTNTPPK